MHIKTLVKRNMMLFFKDKSAVFFSLMAVFVVLFLYICFLGDMMIKPLEEAFGKHARELSDNWIMAGMLGTVSLTTSLSVLGIIIDDKSKRILQDFQVSPLTPKEIIISYILSTFIITFLVSLFTLGIAELYIVSYGGEWLTLSALGNVLLIMCISIFSCTTMLFVIMSFFTSTSSFSNVTTIIGTLSGFLMGIYVPIGSLPTFLQTAIRFFPPSHGASLFRKAMLEEPMQRIFSSFSPETLSNFREQFGLDFYYGNTMCTTPVSIAVLFVTGLAFLIVAFLIMKRKK